MKLKLIRKWKKKDYTIGELYIDGNFFSNTIEDTDRDLKQGMSLSQIQKIKVPSKTAIPTGIYNVTIDIVSPRFGSKQFYMKNANGGKLPRLLNVKGFDGVLMHCLTPDTQILTEDGWKNMEQFNTNPVLKCYSYNTQTGKAELVDIQYYVENDYEGELYCNNGARVNYSVTDEHNIYGGFKKHDGTCIWEFKKAKDTPKNAKYIAAAYKDGESITDKQKTFYRILMAVVADGYILNWSMDSSQVRFHFNKERKISRIKQLLNDLNSPSKEYKDSVGNTHITLSSDLSALITEILNPYRDLTAKKELPWELLKLKSDDLKDLVLEYLFWDGRWENYLKNNKNMQISSTNLRTIDVLQAMAILSGMRASIKDETGGTASERANPCYALCLYNNQEIVTPEPNTYNTEHYNGKVWCVGNCNHTIFIRKNNRVMVIGNCGNTAEDSSGCIIVGQNKAAGKVLNSQDTFIKLYKKLQESKDTITITIE